MKQAPEAVPSEMLAEWIIPRLDTTNAPHRSPPYPAPERAWVWRMPDGHWQVAFAPPDGVSATEYRQVKTV